MNAADLASPAGRDTLVIAECFGDDHPDLSGRRAGRWDAGGFIRLSRCNLSCDWCDTRYTWDWRRYDPRKESSRLSVRTWQRGRWLSRPS